MTDHAASVRGHYQAAITDRDALLARIAKIVDAMEPPIGAIQLAPIDQFHMGGLAATIAIAGRTAPKPDDLVLDAGSGLGGPARYLAETYGCRVEGVDLSPDYVAIARMLTDRAGLSDRVTFREGELTRLPFADGRFDLVWTQHVAMNIADRTGLYGELRRVLKPGGRLVFYDPMAADGHPQITFPVPWAETPQTSTLLTIAETKAALEAAGFAVTAIDDVTETAFGWAAQQGAPQPGGANPGLIVGSRMTEMVANFGRNLREGRARLAFGIAEATHGQELREPSGMRPAHA